MSNYSIQQAEKLLPELDDSNTISSYKNEDAARVIRMLVSDLRAADRVLAEKRADYSTREEPLTLPKDGGNQFRAGERYVGVTGTLFPGEPATVVIVTPDNREIHMTADYGKLVTLQLAEVSSLAGRHNTALEAEHDYPASL